jgi:hypothetical protein
LTLLTLEIRTRAAIAAAAMPAEAILAATVLIAAVLAIAVLSGVLVVRRLGLRCSAGDERGQAVEFGLAIVAALIAAALIVLRLRLRL